MREAEPVNILIVDDRPENLLALGAVLEPLGQNLVEAASGRAALRAVLKQDFAVIILDVQMPEMDGFETAALIRERERSRHTPIIFITAIGKSDEFVFRGYMTGAVDYIIKPIVPEILKAKVAVFVDLFQMREQVKRQAAQLAAANQQLQAANAQLEMVNRELEAFSYSASHDLRAPLRSIGGFSQALLEDYADKLDAPGKQLLERVHAAAARMSELIEDLLQLSRVSHAEMRCEAVNLSVLAHQVAAGLRQTQPERAVEFVIAPGVTANGDASLLRVVLENLLGNAYKYTSKHPRARIEFGAQVTSDGWRVTGDGALDTRHPPPVTYFVRDDGVGFDMAFADKLFRAFQRLHSPSEFSGTGIGLATVARIIQRHGGRVWAEGAVEKGATFYFTLGE